jgi:bifunctional isochorismate lyase/aryl carrier protein
MIPPVAPYPMPKEAELPANVASWTPDARRAVLLIHDMQRYFVDAFPAETSPVVPLVSHIADVRSVAVRLGIPVVYTAQPGAMTRRDRGLLHDFWGPGMNASGAERGIVDALSPAAGDTVLTKWRYSAFQRTPLRELMASTGRDQLLVCGIYGHIGCLMTISDAFSMDIQAFLVADAVADLSGREHRLALEYVAGRCGMVVSTRRLIDDLRSRPGV